MITQADLDKLKNGILMYLDEKQGIQTAKVMELAEQLLKERDEALKELDFYKGHICEFRADPMGSGRIYNQMGDVWERIGR